MLQIREDFSDFFLMCFFGSNSAIRCQIVHREGRVFPWDGRSGRMDERNNRWSKKGLGWHCLV